MTFETLYATNLVLELNSGDSNTLYTTARRKAAVNAGMLEFADLTECYVRRSTIAVSCNTSEYVLSTLADFSRLSNKGLPEYWVTSSGSSARTTILSGWAFPRKDELALNRELSGWRESTTVGSPTAYYIRPDAGQLLLGLNIRPDVGSSEVAVLRVPYVARPAEMTSTGEIPFTDAGGNTRADLTPYHQALVHYAAYRLLPLVGDYDGAKNQMVLFTDYVRRFIEAMRPKGGTGLTFARDYLRETRRRRDGDGVPDTQWS